MVRTPRICFLLALGACVLPASILAQDDAREVAALRRQVAAIRATLPSITEAAEYAAGHFKDDPTKRLLAPKSLDPGFFLEFYYRAGGPPETQSSDNPATSGLVLLPVRHWEGTGLGVAMLAEQLSNQGRPVITIGPKVDRPSLPLGRRFLDNGSLNGDRAHADLNAIANIIVGWTWYAEVVAAATRDGWWLGSYLSVIVPGGTGHNADVRFRMPVPPPAVLPAGQLGGAYLDTIDEILAAAEQAAHRALVGRAADSLRTAKADGRRIFVASCGHYLQEEIQRDTVGTPFRSLDWRWDVAGKLRARGAAPGDAMIWFAYGGYDCPNVDVSTTFRDAGLSVIAVTDRMEPNKPQGTIGPLPPGVSAVIPLHWLLPDAGAPLPFPPGAVGATASIDMALHYVWLKRLVGP